MKEYNECVDLWKIENWECTGCKYGPPIKKADRSWIYYVVGGVIIFSIIACIYYVWRTYYGKKGEDEEEVEEVEYD